MPINTWPDENEQPGADLPDREFELTQLAILQLLPRIIPVGGVKWSDPAILMHYVDETVAEIGHIWMEII
jgi:hypothetical protein